MDTDWFFLSKQYVTMQYKHGKMFYSLKSYILQCDICMFYNMILPRMTVACGINFIADSYRQLPTNGGNCHLKFIIKHLLWFNIYKNSRRFSVMR